MTGTLNRLISARPEPFEQKTTLSSDDEFASMMAQSSGGPGGESRRLFSKPVAINLASAIRAYQASSSDAQTVLEAAVQAAAADARERGLHPQEVVIALKALQESMVDESPGTPADRDTFQSHVLQTMLKAYFREA